MLTFAVMIWIVLYLKISALSREVHRTWQKDDRYIRNWRDQVRDTWEKADNYMRPRTTEDAFSLALANPISVGKDSDLEVDTRNEQLVRWMAPEPRLGDATMAIELASDVDPLREEKAGLTDYGEQHDAYCASPITACQCSKVPETSMVSTSRHILTEVANKLPDAWDGIQEQIPESYKWDIEYVTTHGRNEPHNGCWTCEPLEDSGPIPLTIAKAPVVLPVEHHWPPIGGNQPPPDPRPSALISCWTELSIHTVRDIFLTFEGSLGFYALISGLLQLIVDEAFDTAWASSHLPHTYGGLKVCYIRNKMEPTMLRSNVAITPGTSTSLQTQSSRVLNSSKKARSTQPLQLNDFIEARVSSTSREKFAGRVGLKVEKDGQSYLVMSSHIITDAILSKSFFGLSRDPMKRLREDWNKNAEIWAGNAKVHTSIRGNVKFSQSID
jgi:hypothetical protein